MASSPVASPPVTEPPRASAGKGWRDKAADFLTTSPAFVPGLLAIGIFIWFAADEAGFRGTTFLPGGLALLALLALSLAALPRPEPRRAALVAVGLMVGYAAWSYLSILWADQQSVAWDGANRTVLYAIVLALFALWPMRGPAAVALLAVYGLGVATVGLVEILRAEDAASSIAFFHEGRLSEPAGYVNANVALWFSGFWPCLILAGRRGVPAVLRGLLMGAAGLLACLAVLGQSRAWLGLLPIMMIIAVLVVPGRGRTIVSMAAVTAAVLAVRGTLVDYYHVFDPARPPGAAFGEVVDAILTVAVVLAVVGLVVALADRRIRVGERAARRVSAGFAVAFALACVGAVVAAAVVIDNPRDEISQRWDEFKSGEGEPSFSGSRLSSTSVASYRSDLWRVAWQNFKDEPITGVGADNFLRDYLKRGKTDEAPSYPHSLEFRVLSQTGIVGVLLLAGAFAAGLVAAMPALRSATLAGGAAGAATLGFIYWVVHGSLDWFWEFAGLGAPAIAMLGIAIAVAAALPGRPGLRLPGGRALSVGLALLGMVLAVAFTMPWLAERELRSAREVVRSDPDLALEKLDRASDLNPLSPAADKTAALVYIRARRFDKARAELEQALDRDEGDSFAWLQLGAIASIEMRQDDALRNLRRARGLSPNDRVVAHVLRAVRKGRAVSPERVNRAVLREIDVRVGPG
jgi:tetratricopeptide (TPR) repeat protein